MENKKIENKKIENKEIENKEESLGWPQELWPKIEEDWIKRLGAKGYLEKVKQIINEDE